MTTTDRDRAALLRAILEAPEDDAPRLVYADLLEEAGEGERAAYIRCRLEWDRLPDCGHDWVLRPGGWSCPTCCRKDQLHAAHSDAEGFPPWERLPAGWFAPLRLEDVDLSRGFVAEVRTTLGDWWGQACARCEGRGDGWTLLQSGKEIRVDCPACSGTRHTPGHGSAVVACQPLERVWLVDREPGETANNPPAYGWLLRTEHFDLRRPEELPEALFNLLPDTRPNDGWKWSRRFFPTADAARLSLALAAANWARREAGLPLLPLPQEVTHGT